MPSISIQSLQSDSVEKPTEVVIEISCEMGVVRDAVEGLERLAAICEILDDSDVALTHYETAITLVHKDAFEMPYASATEQPTRLTAAPSADGRE